MPGPFQSADWKLTSTTVPSQTYKSMNRELRWWTSGRQDGQLVLLPQEFTLKEHQVLAYTRQFNVGWAPVVLAPASRIYASSEFARERTLATNAAWARLVDKTTSGTTAGLGVTFSQWKQSWDMITNRSNAIRRIAKNLYRPPKPRPPYRTVRDHRGVRYRVPNTPRLSRRGVEYGSSADHFLEGIFGWLPLVQDMYAAAEQLTKPIPYYWVSGRGSCEGTRTYSVPHESGQAHSIWRCTQSMRVEGVNPNQWILNQLGLINPAVVLWDVVPWSFVVGWFGNFQAILSSYSDLYGLNYRHGNVTWSERYMDNQTRENTYPGSHPGYAVSHKTLRTRDKSRSVTGLVRPSVVVHMPKVSMTRGLISAALATQQVRRLSSSI